MLKKTITFETLDGVEVTEDFYFNLTVTELAEMELGKDGGLEKYIQTIIHKRDATAVIKIFKDIILAAVGVRSSDGRRFIKSPEISQGFAQTDAYNKLFMELLTDAEASAAFMNGIVPKNIETQANKISVDLPDTTLPPGLDQAVRDQLVRVKKKEFKDLTNKDLESMDRNALIALLKNQ